MPRRRRGWRPLPDRAHPSSRAYERLLSRHVDQLEALLMGALRRAYRARADAASADEWSDEPWTDEDAAEVSRLITVEVALAREPTPPPMEEIARVGGPIARKATGNERRQLIRAGAPPTLLIQRLGLQGPELLGIALTLAPGEEMLVAGWAMDGARLIRKMDRAVLQRLPGLVEESVRAGQSWRTLARDVQHVIGTTRSHARLIARDQTAQLNGRITEHLQQRAGVAEYIWRSSHDSRVRPSHSDADGKTYAWASAGAPGVGFYGEPAHPGQAGNCRCTAEPVVPVDW